jgi:hypothetical protein
MQPNDIRRWIRLCEDQRAEYYVHVSPIKNLRAILAKGLIANDGGGNYSGYETSLSGTYVTREPQLIHDHINARMMEKGFVLVLVQVANTEGVIDEDALHPWLIQCIEEIVGADYAKTMINLDPDDAIWHKVPALFQSRLGPPDETELARDPNMVAEFVDAVIRSELYGEDGDPGWWEGAKEQLLKAFPQVTHPHYGNRYSLRLPSVGYTGATHIVAVISVRNRQEKVVHGSVPPAAYRLIDASLEIQ